MTLEWVICSCVLILVVLLLRAALGERISARLRYALWGVVLLRLLVPVQLLTLPAEVAPVPELSWEMEERNIYVIPMDRIPLEEAQENLGLGIEDGHVVSDPNSFGYARVEGEAVTRYAEKISPADLLHFLWAAGAALLALVLLASNLHFAAKLRRVRRPLAGAGERAYVAEGIPSPCLFGLPRPSIYVTAEAAGEETVLQHVLVHEETHRRHGDHIWSALRGVALAIHWWNPLVWLAVVLSRRDGELACDEGALKQLGDGERAAYGETLLTLVTAKARPGDLLSCATTMTGGKRSLTERIRRIARQPKILVSAMTVVVLITVLSAALAFAQPETEETPEAGQAQPNEEQIVETVLPQQPDLNRDGVAETLTLITHQTGSEATDWYGLQLSQGAEVLWKSPEAFHAHAGWYALFLAELEGEDYLLEYRPGMWQGVCSYSYRLFALEADGEPAVRQEEEIQFDINVGSGGHGAAGAFDPSAIAAFMETVNGLLADSVQLLNTDEDLLRTFEKNGRLYDDLWWLDGGDYGFVRDEARSLEEDLAIWHNTAAAATAVPSLSEIFTGFTAESFDRVTGRVADLAALADVLNGAAVETAVPYAYGDPLEGFIYSLGLLWEESPNDSGVLAIELEVGSKEGLVWVMCRGSKTTLFYSENPDNDATYLTDSSYAFTSCLEDSDLYWMVRGSADTTVSGEAVQEAYEAVTAERPFFATVETADGEETEVRIHQGNDYNVEHVGLYLPVSYSWTEATEADWDRLSRRERGTVLTLTDQDGRIFQCCSGSDLVRLTMNGEIVYLRARPNGPSDVFGDGNLFDFAMMVPEDGISYGIWNDPAVAGTVTDLEEVAQQLAEQVAENYRDLPDWVRWKPLDMRVAAAPAEGRVFDVYWGEPDQFCCDIDFLVKIEDPMSANAMYWQAGAGLGEATADGYYAWGRRLHVVLDDKGRWYTADRGTGSYTVGLPLRRDEATVEQIVDAYFLTEGFTHDYLLFAYLCDMPQEALAALNDQLDERTPEEAAAFLESLYAHMTAHSDYHELTLEDIRAVLIPAYQAYLD